MKVKELIEKLKKFDGNLEVQITDGYEGIGYTLDQSEIHKYQEQGEDVIVDIGIGGCRIKPD